MVSRQVEERGLAPYSVPVPFLPSLPTAAALRRKLVSISAEKLMLTFIRFSTPHAAMIPDIHGEVIEISATDLRGKFDKWRKGDWVRSRYLFSCPGTPGRG